LYEDIKAWIFLDDADDEKKDSHVQESQCRANTQLGGWYVSKTQKAFRVSAMT